MGRQTAFPGILVEEVRIQSPPFDEPGVVQEFVGEGIISEFEPIKRAAEFTEDTVGDLIESAEEMIGLTRDTFQIRYTLMVRSATDTRISRRGAKARARAFTRAKNPFEPDVINVVSAEVDHSLSGAEVMGRELGTVYRVTTEVTK